jgi:hypothetical protein
VFSKTDNKIFATFSKDKIIKIWNLEDSFCICNISVDNYIGEMKIYKDFIFYNDLMFKNKITIKDLNFSLIEYEKEKKTKNDSTLCLNIGFHLSETSNENIYNIKLITNLILQLKQKNIITSYHFNLHFEPILINEETFDGFIVIGEEPHQYLKNNYNEYQLFKTLAYKKDNVLSWDMHFNKIYYLINSKEIITNIKIDFYNQGTLSPSSSLIVGTNDYEIKIKFDFFDKLIYSRKCKREEKNFMIFYYCYKNKTTKEDLKQFPSLYFANEELDYTFELDYKDLFYENDELIYFLIIFYNYPIEMQEYFFDYNSRWELGMPFLKKYFFTYDYDNKYIGFYNSKKLFKNDNDKDETKNNDKNLLLLVIILLFIFVFVLFFIILLVIKYKCKNKKISAIELKSDDSINDYYHF